jgi:hypothetical protein
VSFDPGYRVYRNFTVIFHITRLLSQNASYPLGAQPASVL